MPPLRRRAPSESPPGAPGPRARFLPPRRRSYTQGLLWDPRAGRERRTLRPVLVRRWRPGVAGQAEERLGDRYFAEGIALVGETLFQLSWREGIAFYRDRATLREKTSFL